MRRPFFYVGEKVLVKKNLNGFQSADYPFGFVKPMRENYGGKIVTITHIGLLLDSELSFIEHKKAYNNDPCMYTIKEDGGTWTWHSSMFLPSFFCKLQLFS